MIWKENKYIKKIIITKPRSQKDELHLLFFTIENALDLWQSRTITNTSTEFKNVFLDTLFLKLVYIFMLKPLKLSTALAPTLRNNWVIFSYES